MALDSISPLDGRYLKDLKDLCLYTSESGLIRYRVEVEIRWLLCMSQTKAITHVRPFSAEETTTLHTWMDDFSEEDAARVKEIDATTRHDVKAVEYFVKEKLEKTSMADVIESVHFGCTSEDINNLSHAMMLRDSIQKVWLVSARQLIADVTELAEENRDATMLAHTHGQPATPTVMGKELAVFVGRWTRQLKQIEEQEYLGKFNGATGCYNSYTIAYPDADWDGITRGFVESMGLTFNPLTTQIESHDYIAEIFHSIVRFNNITLDFDRDAWTYISMGYFKQKIVKTEVGSSIMPHKVNPIDFENSEANLGLSNSVLDHLSSKLAISRLQRDLSDSSALRNVGVGIGYTTLALKSAIRGISRISVDQAALSADLDNSWEVLAEAVQTVMRKNKVDNPYETLKQLTRGESITESDIKSLIGSLDIDPNDKARLLSLTPNGYIGRAKDLIDLIN
ncbi:adenylosuccinate lyase [bacterium]|nr:adenylosuccinate lyase [bacterium]